MCVCYMISEFTGLSMMAGLKSTCGLVLRPDNPVLGCSPDRCIVDPMSDPHYGIGEIKCPYTVRVITPLDAGKSHTEFCSEVHKDHLRLKRTQDYYIQVQGQMTLTGAKWCDFIVYTFRGLHIERIPYDEAFLNDAV